MKIVVCPDSFKECAPAARVAAAIAAGCRRAQPQAEVLELPLADGGEGTVAALVAATAGQTVRCRVTGPLGEPVEAAYGLLGDGQTAVLEMAAASGLELVPAARRDPGVTTTRGTGELVRDALGRGARELLLGIGGSATNDGGSGLATALGVRFLDSAGHELPPGGLALARLARLDRSGLEPRLAEVTVRVACDVDNPLLGERGASRVYGPQKGASPEMVEQLDAALANYAEVVLRDLGRDIREVPGAGAAGGLGAGLLAFCGATLSSGIDLVLDAVGFEAHLAGADLVITGEGRLDEQTLQGKTISGVLRRAQAMRVPVVALAGAVTGDPAAYRAAGLLAAFGITQRPVTLVQALGEAEGWLAWYGEQVVRLFAR